MKIDDLIWIGHVWVEMGHGNENAHSQFGLTTHNILIKKIAYHLLANRGYPSYLVCYRSILLNIILSTMPPYTDGWFSNQCTCISVIKHLIRYLLHNTLYFNLSTLIACLCAPFTRVCKRVSVIS